MKISEEKRFIFVHVSKTAGSSISKLVEPHCIKEQKNLPLKLLSRAGLVPNWRWHHYRIHAPLRVPERRMPAGLFEKMTKFAVVRNPWSRLVSEYHYKMQGRGQQRRMVERLGTFSNWLRWMGSASDTSPYKPQVNMLKRRDGSMGIDHLLRFESLATDWNAFSKSIGISEALPVLNTSSHQDWRAYYAKEDAEFVADVWKKDIEAFEYRFDSSQ